MIEYSVFRQPYCEVPVILIGVVVKKKNKWWVAHGLRLGFVHVLHCYEDDCSNKVGIEQAKENRK